MRARGPTFYSVTQCAAVGAAHFVPNNMAANWVRGVQRSCGGSAVRRTRRGAIRPPVGLQRHGTQCAHHQWASYPLRNAERAAP